MDTLAGLAPLGIMCGGLALLAWRTKNMETLYDLLGGAFALAFFIVLGTLIYAFWGPILWFTLGVLTLWLVGTLLNEASR